MISKIKNRVTKTFVLVNVCRFLISFTFLFSGFVKAIDPLGTQYKIEDYAEAFGMAHLIPGFVPLFLSMALATVEFMLGVFLFFGFRRNVSSIAALVMMSVMTPLTLYLAIANPVSDCGCFGDALVLTNWQTFWKNVVLLAASIILFRYRREIFAFLTWRTRWMVSFYTFVFIVSLSFYCIYALPVFDFRPYKIGTDINEAMSIPEDKPQPVYETTFTLEKDGVTKEFTIDNYPQDTTWHFIDSHTMLVSKGYEPPIHDFAIEDLKTGDDITQDILTDPGYTFLLISHRLDEASDTNLDLINGVYDYCVENGYRFYCLTSSLQEDIDRWRDNSGAEYDFCAVDDITLKTIIRSNPGLMLLKNGVILNKWSHNMIPSEEELEGKRLEDIPLGQVAEVSRAKVWLYLASWYLLPLLGVVAIEFAMFGHRTWKNRKKQTTINNNNQLKN